MRPKMLSVIALPALVVAAGAVFVSMPTPTRVSYVVVAAGQVQVAVEDASSPSAAEQRVAELRRRPDVLAASTPRRRHILVDPRQSEQWALTRLDATDAWPEATGKGVVVAVVDTGVDASHPDLAGAVLPGYDVYTKGDGRTDPNGHGTHVSGIIAARRNSVGTAGLAPDARILPVRVLDASGSGDDSDIAKGVLWAADHGADIINMSLGGDEDDPVLAAAVKQVASRGILVVVAAGNSGASGNATSYPAADPGAFAVAATTPGDQRALFSNTGKYVDIAAPGMGILSTLPGSSWGYESGTSMAAPYVAASAALVMESSGLRGSGLGARLSSSATDAGGAGTDTSFGEGVVDPYAALTDGKRRPGPTTSLPNLDPNTSPTLPSPGMPTLGPLPTPSLGQLPALRVPATLTLEAAKAGSPITGSLATGRIALGKRSVTLQEYSGTWKSREALTTDAFGRLKSRAAARSTARLRLVFAGDSIASSATSGAVTVP